MCIYSFSVLHSLKEQESSLIEDSVWGEKWLKQSLFPIAKLQTKYKSRYSHRRSVKSASRRASYYEDDDYTYDQVNSRQDKDIIKFL